MLIIMFQICENISDAFNRYLCIKNCCCNVGTDAIVGSLILCVKECFRKPVEFKVTLFGKF